MKAVLSKELAHLPAAVAVLHVNPPPPCPCLFVCSSPCTYPATVASGYIPFDGDPAWRCSSSPLLSSSLPVADADPMVGSRLIICGNDVSHQLTPRARARSVTVAARPGAAQGPPAVVRLQRPRHRASTIAETPATPGMIDEAKLLVPSYPVPGQPAKPNRVAPVDDADGLSSSLTNAYAQPLLSLLAMRTWVCQGRSTTKASSPTAHQAGMPAV